MKMRVDPKSVPVVALESTVISHGLPHPLNVETALEMERKVEEGGAVPATVGIIDGEIVVGLTKEEIEFMAKEETMKVGVREIPYAIAKKLNADTTVSATMRIAKMVGIKVFATGGIGGYHKGVFDISQDLTELSRNRMVVVSAGAKSILDLEKTVELLETLGVVLVGFRTDEFPAFYSRRSGIKLNMRVDSVEEIVEIFKEMERMDYESALLVANPVPEESEMPFDEVERMVEEAEKEAKKLGIRGKELTPFLLKRLSEMSGGKTLESNVALLKNNALLAGTIASKLVKERLIGI